MSKKGFLLNENGYFNKSGVDIMAFDDIYPVGHQSGVCVIMHGQRIATNGDIRFEQTPGQWQPVPKQLERTVSPEDNQIDVTLSYPDTEAHLRGFNPMLYPDFEFTYQVHVKGTEDGALITVDLSKPVPEQYIGKLRFNLELFPGILFGKSWIMDNQSGIFPRQPNGPVKSQPSNYPYTESTKTLPDARASREDLSSMNKSYSPIVADDLVSEPYATGNTFTLCPEDPLKRLTVSSKENEISLYDGRMNHNNGWFALSSPIPAGKTKGAIQWTITPNVVDNWTYTPVVQVSQVGYHPNQPKIAVIEFDARVNNDLSSAQADKVVLSMITGNGPSTVIEAKPNEWGKFLRYRYLTFDFSDVKEEGLYQISYNGSLSAVFRISKDIFERGVWQPVIEYFLPVQMCHMRVNEKYKVWHGDCHTDDAYMAPLNYNHFDGYYQGASTLTKYAPGDYVPGLNRGGWHDAGDFDLRVESQSGEVYNLSLAIEEFNAYCDTTTIDQESQITEIHQPDGINDLLQQIEHGLLTLLGAYESMGRLYRGIICRNLRQYVLLGDPVNMTSGTSISEDARWVFTEDNPTRELQCAAHIAAASRVIRDYNPILSESAYNCAVKLYKEALRDRVDDEADNIVKPVDMTFFINSAALLSRIHADVELYLTTMDMQYMDDILNSTDRVVENIADIAWIICKIWDKIPEGSCKEKLYEALKNNKKRIDDMSKETPYGIPYRPHIWGAGWMIQSTASHYYFMHKALPDLYGPDMIFRSLDFILGTHPGSNTASFASGVGSKSATTAYGINRSDWSYTPGGVVSGTALIRPDFPELLEFPYLWQQTEYVIGGGSSNYMLLVLAANHILKS